MLCPTILQRDSDLNLLTSLFDDDSQDVCKVLVKTAKYSIDPRLKGKKDDAFDNTSK